MLAVVVVVVVVLVCVVVVVGQAPVPCCEPLTSIDSVCGVAVADAAVVVEAAGVVVVRLTNSARGVTAGSTAAVPDPDEPAPDAPEEALPFEPSTVLTAVISCLPGRNTT